MPNDLELLQGAWTVTELEMDGNKMDAGVMGEGRILIEGNRFTSTGMGAEYKGTMKVDELATPRRLDMKFTAGPEKGNTNLCIYELGGDQWKLCIATRGTVRPSKFTSEAGSGIAVETLTRGAAGGQAKGRGTAAKARGGAAEPTAAGPATEFEGEWPMVSGVMSGAAMEPSMVKWVKRVTHGNVITVMAGPQVMMKVEFTHDASKSPKTIDYVNLAGSNKGKAQQGIYRVDGDMMTVCVAPPGAARPEKFESTKKDGATLTVWSRP